MEPLKADYILSQNVHFYKDFDSIRSLIPVNFNMN